MPCYRPITAYRSKKGPDKETGKTQIVFNTQEGFIELPVDVPCGQCIGCKQERSRQWATRCVYEAQMYDDNTFVTLTYAPEHLPPGGTLRPKDMTNFLKRLRKKFVPKNPYCKKYFKELYDKFKELHQIRYFQCGEYGDNFGRAHHHILLFNIKFPDEKLWRIHKKLGVKYYRSNILEKLWPWGHSEIGAVNFESAAYVARYVTKKITGKQAEKHYENIDIETGEITQRKPEYITMSRRPGIGRKYYEEYGKEIYNHDKCVIREGLLTKPPKYYDSLFDAQNPEDFLLLKEKRKEEGKKHEKDNTPLRLKVKEACKTKQFNLLVRPIERDVNNDFNHLCNKR